MDFELGAISILAAGLGGAGVYTAALALGVRHGIDWDHIAAITDITSTTAGVGEEEESWLIAEPGVMLTDESHHTVHGPHHHESEHHAVIEDDDAPHSHGAHGGLPEPAGRGEGLAVEVKTAPTGIQHQRTALIYGSLYALGHSAVVVLLGMAAILASEFLPSWIDPVMERVVGVTLIFLSVYLFYSLFRYFRRGGEFRLRSRWMLVFAGVSNAWHWTRSRIGPHEHVHVHANQTYGARTSFGIGLIHGVGAETGTQALVIATAVGATNQLTGVLALTAFVAGLLVSNSFVTVASTYGFVSAQKRQWIYVGVGIFAAVFSLFIGLLFIGASTGILPDLDSFVRWIGGPAD